MRYLTIDNIVFTDKDGNVFTLKDMREYPAYVLMENIKIQKGDMLDEIASRKNIYGDDAEMMTFKIFDFNRLQIVESDFNTLKTLDIPV